MLVKEEKGVKFDNELDVEDLKELVKRFKAAVKEYTGKDFPESAWEQLWGGICAVFDSWMNERAIIYRRMNQIPEEWGTAVNVQAMVYGNMGNNSATGVAFSRDAATGENIFNGEYLINAQGEDVVAGVRTPQQITVEGSRRWAKLQGISEDERREKYPSLEESMPVCAAELIAIAKRLEDYYKDMQDMEFTIQDGKLWMLQTRNGKRTGAAMVKIAMDLLRAGEIDEKTALLRIEPQKLDELLHPVFDKDALKRIETSPEDLRGMAVAQGILTMRGGMTSHAAVVARGMGKCCVSGAGEIVVDYKAKTVEMNGKVYKEGDWISLNGSTGDVYDGQVPTTEPELDGDFGAIMNLSDKFAKTLVRTNADSPRDAKQARRFGAQGIGLCRTEHMFFEGDRIKSVREMILASDEEGRRTALAKLLPMQRGDFEGIFEAMDGYGVTVRLLDPPLHEFVPHQTATQKELAAEMGLTLEEVKAKVDSLEEFNPMLGHRGCRLGITYPEITEMQTRAIIEAALACKARGIKVLPEIMVPLVGSLKELQNQADVINTTAAKVFEEKGDSVIYKVGTMIEVPRAALTANEIAEVAEFFSFGTNDLTQMTFGFSRDDAPKFLKFYKEHGIIKVDPFEVLDQTGVGQLVEMGVKKGRATRPDLKVGICGEHGGEPSSVKFCANLGMNYVSCSPFRVPIARVAAAQAAIED